MIHLRVESFFHYLNFFNQNSSIFTPFSQTISPVFDTFLCASCQSRLFQLKIPQFFRKSDLVKSSQKNTPALPIGESRRKRSKQQRMLTFCRKWGRRRRRRDSPRPPGPWCRRRSRRRAGRRPYPPRYACTRESAACWPG